MIITECSARHAHLTKETYGLLFGNEPIKLIKELNIKGEYVTDKFIFDTDTDTRFRVLFPFRTYNQVEVSVSDCKKLGIEPVRAHSGELEKYTQYIEFMSNVWDNEETIMIPVIVPYPHVHVPEEFKWVRRVQLKYGNVTFLNVHCRVSNVDNFVVHLTTDEFNCIDNPNDVSTNLSTYEISGKSSINQNIF